MSATWEIREGGALKRLREMPERSVQCCVTSPPYYGLRDYGTGTWDGGEPDCQHRVGGQVPDSKALGAIVAGVRPGVDASVCRDCGARRVDEQIGLEASLDEYLEKLVAVFREVRRVLRDDGTLWLNMGDSYNSGTNAQRHPSSNHGGNGYAKHGYWTNEHITQRVMTTDCKAKDLIGVPWLLAFALRADGWWLRSDIVWAKPNPMPESVTDRPTRAHEYLFLLSKSERYFYDQDAIREPWADEREGADGSWQVRERNVGGRTDGFTTPNGIYPRANGGRNKRDVWTIPAAAYSEAHFATFPPKLVEPCILAGTSPKACGECGAPWGRVVERKSYGNLRAADNKDGKRDLEIGITRNDFGGQARYAEYEAPKTVGWQPTCEHGDDSGHGVVLDPFAGAGTAGMVALRLDRSFVGIELKPAYAALARRRICDDAPLLNTPSEVAAG